MKTSLWLLALSFAFLSCEKYEDDRLDFSNTYPAFVEFTSAAAITVAPGDPVSAEIQIREYHGASTVTWQVTGENFSESGTVDFTEEDYRIGITFTAPDTEVPLTLNWELTDATGGIAIGRPQTTTPRTERVVNVTP